MERKTNRGNPLLETELRRADNPPGAAGLLSLAAKQRQPTTDNVTRSFYQHGESAAVVYGAGQDGRGVAEVSLEVAVCVAVGQQELRRQRGLTDFCIHRHARHDSRAPRGRRDKVFPSGRGSRVLSSG